MLKVAYLSKGYLWAFGLTGAGLGLIFLHEFLKQSKSELVKTPLIKDLSGSLAPVAASFRTHQSFPTTQLIAELEEADLQWKPREEVLPDGSTRYLYKRRTNEPDLSVADLRQLIETPPTFEKQRHQVSHLLDTLRSAGVHITLSPTFKPGAAAEWDHRSGILRIQPEMPKRGSVDFLQVLTHEAIHVAQSCRAGSLTAKPKPLGVDVVNTPSLNKKLRDPIYLGTSRWEQSLEKEAYGIQNNATLVRKLLERECKLAINVPN